MAYPFAPFGMNSMSLYGNDSFYSYPMTGMTGMMQEYGKMFPMPGAYGNWDYTQFEKKYQERNLENMTRQDAISNLHSFVINDDQSGFENAYRNALRIEKERLSKIMPNASSAKLEAAARTSINTTYQQIAGKPLSQALYENGDNPIWQGIKDSLCLGMNRARKVEDNIEMVAGTNRNTPGATVGRTVGGAVGGAAIGAAIGALIAGLPTGGAGAPVGAILGAKIGAGIGAGLSLLKGLFS